jgi:hypothetical protein
MAHRMRGSHQRGQATARTQSQPVQGRCRNEALGRPRGDSRQPGQHQPRDGQAAQPVIPIPLTSHLAGQEAEAEQEGASTTVSGAVVAIAQVIQWPIAFAALWLSWATLTAALAMGSQWPRTGLGAAPHRRVVLASRAADAADAALRGAPRAPCPRKPGQAQGLAGCGKVNRSRFRRGLLSTVDR